MYTHIRLINHSLNYMKYMRGETCYKEHPEKIVEIDMPTSSGIRYTMNRYLEMRLDCKCGKPSLMGSTIQVTLSPIKEDTLTYNGDDWKKLWITYLEEMDKIDTVRVKDDQGQMVEHQVEKTRFTESNQLACLHMEANSRIPHIHGAICPVDSNGRTYGLDFLMERSRIAAEQVSKRLGLTDSISTGANNLSTAYHTCLDVILNMCEAWSWERFKNGVRKRGYQILEKKDIDGNVQQWSMRKEDKMFRDTDMGEGFRFGNIYHLWHELIEPYNNPEDILSSEEILEEIRLRGWYNKFLQGEIQSQMEARLYDMLQQKLVSEQEQIGYEVLEDAYEGSLVLPTKTIRYNTLFPKDKLSQQALYQYYDLICVDSSKIKEENSNGSSDTYDECVEDINSITSSSSVETEQPSTPSSRTNVGNVKKRLPKIPLPGESNHTEHNKTYQEVDMLKNNQLSKEDSRDLKI